MALVFVLSASAARVGPQPTITGVAVVGGTLTSSDAGDGLYQWQRCNSAVNCADAAGNANWEGIAGARQISYVVSPGDVGYFIRVRTKGTSQGEQWAASAAVGPVSTGPQHGVSVLVEPVSGVVKVKKPGAKAFSVLTGLTEIPVKSIIDTRGSRVRLTAAIGALGSQTADDSADFYAGLFKILQSATTNSPATAKLFGKLACGRKSKSKSARASGEGPIAVAAGKRRRRGLWGSGSGGYRTSGSGSTGSVVGTTWLTKDTCAGTLTRVIEGAGVRVFNKNTKKKVFVGPGEKYFAALD